MGAGDLAGRPRRLGVTVTASLGVSGAVCLCKYRKVENQKMQRLPRSNGVASLRPCLALDIVGCERINMKK